MPKAVTKRRGKAAPEGEPEDAPAAAEGEAEHAPEVESEEPPAGNDEGDTLPEGKSDAASPEIEGKSEEASGVKTRSNSPSKSSSQRRPKRKPASDSEEGDDIAEEDQQATPKKSNVPPRKKKAAKKHKTGDEAGDGDRPKPGRKSPRRKKASLSRDDGEWDESVGSVGSVSSAADIQRPYAKSFSFNVRFIDVEDKPKRVLKYSKEVDGTVRNQKLVSEKEPDLWMQSFQTKDPPPLPPAKKPSHNPATGHIGKTNSDFMSQSTFVIPKALEGRRGGRRLEHFRAFTTFTKIQEHWLKKPMESLAKKVMRHRPKTRLSQSALMRGDDIFVGSSDLPAGDFVRIEDDDIELVDYVKTLGPIIARLWHSSEIPKDGMMWRVITTVLNNESKSTGYGRTFLEEHDDVEFLGFVSVHTKPNAERSIQAFNVAGMVLFRYTGTRTDLGCLVVAREMCFSSMQERLVQLVQILQLRRHGNSQVEFSIKSRDSHARHALKYAGFPSIDIPTEDEHAITGKKLLEMAKCSFMQIWMKHYSSITMTEDPPPGNQRFLEKVLIDAIKELTSCPFNHITNDEAASCVLRINDLLTKGIESLPQDERNAETLREIVNTEFVRTVGASTHLRLSIFTHLIVERFLSGTRELHILETTLELLQDISITIPLPGNEWTSFAGDEHECRLFCWKCRQGFGRVTEFDGLLARAPVDILIHYDCWPNQPHKHKSKHVYAALAPLFSSEEAYNQVFTLDASPRRAAQGEPAFNEDNLCRFGHHCLDFLEEGHLKPVEENLIHLTAFQEAVNIDANFTADNTVMSDRLLQTQSLLKVFFERMAHVVDYYSDTDVDHSSIQGGGSWGLLCAGEDNADAAVKAVVKHGVHGTPDAIGGIRFYRRKVTLLNRMFANNVLWVIQEMDPGAEDLSDSINEVFREFFGFKPNQTPVTAPEDFICKLQNINVTVSIKDCYSHRPVQEKIHVDSPVPLSELGEGWDTTEARQWFAENPPEKKQRSATPREVREDNFILRTITHMRFRQEGRSGERIYEFRCDDMPALAEKNTYLQTRHKELLETETFPCSQDLVMSFPFDVVKQWRRNNWNSLEAYVDPLKKHIAEMERCDIIDIQLWRKDARTGECIFRARLETTGRTGTKSSRVVYIKASDIIQDFSGERWVILPYTLLSNVCSHRVLTLGDGATTKSRDPHDPQGVNHQQDLAQDRAPQYERAPQRLVGQFPDSWSNPADDRHFNIWWSADNPQKHCLEGCLSNILHLMRAGGGALEFKRLSILDDASLLRELEMEAFPKKVRKGAGQKTDAFQKCKWLLRKFNCNTTKPLQVAQFRSLSSMVDNFSQIRFPVIVSMKITNSMFNHVIGIWKKMIIDFENDRAYPLTINNLDFSCGPNSEFLCVTDGYGILPSKDMRRACKRLDNFTDWGEEDVGGELGHLFKTGKYQ